MVLESPDPDLPSTDEIETALELCIRAIDQSSSEKAHESLLNAVGNNHAGTYRESVISLIDRLGPILRSGKCWSRHAIVEALIDLYGSFEPEPGYAVCNGEPLDIVLRRHIEALRPSILCSVESGDVPTNVQELLGMMDGV